MTVSSEDYKDGMRRLAASVGLITISRPDGRRVGMTATAICSVSTDPPTLLCCINRNTAARAAVLEAQAFAVNILSVEDRELAGRFASPIAPEERFASGQWEVLATGAPILRSAVASLDCRLVRAVDVATHSTVFGEVEAVRTRAEEVAPLLYAHGGYGGFAAAESRDMGNVFWVPAWGEDW